MAAANTNAASFQRVEDAIMRRIYYRDHGEELEDHSPRAAIEQTSDTKTAPEPLQRVGFTNLPVELVLHILKLLPGLEIARFQRVSKATRRLVAGSVDLQYTIERYLAGTIDPSSASSIPLSDRLSITRKARKAWADFAHAEVQTIADDNISGATIANGKIYARKLVEDGEEAVEDEDDEDGMNREDMLEFKECRSLRLGLLPSAVRGIECREWTLTNLPVFKTFACDYDQDVLVLLASRVVDFKLTIHVLSLETGTAHPLTLEAPLEVYDSNEGSDDGPGVSRSFDATIFGEYVGITMIASETEYFGQLWVVNWKTGQTCLAIHGVYYFPAYFAFLDSNYLVATPPTDVEGVPVELIVFNYRTFSPEPLTLEEAREACGLAFELPPIHSQHEYGPTVLSCRSVGNTTPSGDPIPSWANKLPVLRAEISVSINRWQETFDLMIPANTILSRVAVLEGSTPLEARMIRWEDWMKETRLLVSDSVSLGICGSRYLTVKPMEDAIGSREIIIYDFDSPPAMLKDVLSGDFDAELNERFVHGAPSYDFSHFFDSPVETRAPCRVIRTGIVVSLRHIVELYEDGIIVRNYDGDEDMCIYPI